MPTGVRKLPNGKYQADITLGTVRRKRTFLTSKAAKAWRAAQEADANKGEWIDPHHANTTLGEWIDQWLKVKSGEVAEGSVKAYRHRLAHLPRDIPLGSITRFTIKQWRSELNLNASPQISKACITTLKSVLSDAVDAGLIRRSPAEGIKNVKQERREMVALSIEEIAAIREVSSPWVERIIIGLVWLGCRSSDLREITRDDIVMGREVRIGDIKTGAEPRYLPLGPLRDMALSSPTEHIFPGKGGQQLYVDSFRRAWRRSVERSGIDRQARPHDLRHTCASLMLEAGASIPQVQHWLGHASPAITLSTYSHLMPGGLGAAGEKFATVFMVDKARKEAM